MKNILTIVILLLISNQICFAESEAYKAYLAKYASQNQIVASTDVNATIGSEDFHADINSFADHNASAPVAATIPAGQTTCKKASNKHKASMFGGTGAGNGPTGLAVKGGIVLSAFIYNKIIDYVEEDCVTPNTNIDEITTLRNNHTAKTSAWSRAMTARDDTQNALNKESDPQKIEILTAKLAKLDLEVQETSIQEVEAETAVNTYLAQNQK
jgi:hypothetical protein